MLKEVVKTNNNRLVIDLPKDYVGKDLEVLIFKKEKKKYNEDELLQEFEEISKNISSIEDKSIDLTKIDEAMYNALL